MGQAWRGEARFQSHVWGRHETEDEFRRWCSCVWCGGVQFEMSFTQRHLKGMWTLEGELVMGQSGGVMSAVLCFGCIMWHEELPQRGSNLCLTVEVWSLNHWVTRGV